MHTWNEIDIRHILQQRNIPFHQQVILKTNNNHETD